MTLLTEVAAEVGNQLQDELDQRIHIIQSVDANNETMNLQMQIKVLGPLNALVHQVDNATSAMPWMLSIIGVLHATTPPEGGVLTDGVQVKTHTGCRMSIYLSTIGRNPKHSVWGDSHSHTLRNGISHRPAAI